MNMQQLYDHMKDALRAFDLTWRDMDKVYVWTDINGDLHFRYEAHDITVAVGL